MTILEHTPCFTVPEAVEMARNLFYLTATATLLPSERDQNFLMKEGSGKRFVLKIANATEKRDRLDCQNQAMLRIAETSGICPMVIPNRDGELITAFHGSGKSEHLVRLVSYLEGLPLGRVPRHSDPLRFELGRRLGQLDRALAGFEHPGAYREGFKWDLSNGLSVVERFAPLIADKMIRKQVEALASVFVDKTASLLPGLRKGVIHNDANDYNVIVNHGPDLYSRHQRIAGFIDFGDMVHSYSVGDPAIAIAYAILNRPHPLAVAARIVSGYHSECPFEENEISALFGLVCLRLCMSASIAAYQQQQRPDNAYLAISQEPIRHTLPLLMKIHPRFAEATFRNACTQPPLPRSASVCRWLEENRRKAVPLTAVDFGIEPVRWVDLGLETKLVTGDAASDSIPAVACRIARVLKSKSAAIGFSVYDETRLLGVANLMSGVTPPIKDEGCASLGVDLFFTTAGMPVCAPFAGMILGVKKSTFGSGAETLLLEQTTDEGAPFYIRFKGLTANSAARLKPGERVEAGRQIGTAARWGGTESALYRLHVQIIVDLMGMGNDFPDHAPVAEQAVYTSFSPDPNLILGIPRHRWPDPAPDRGETLAIRRRIMGRNLTIGYRNPLKIRRGWMQYLFDDRGRRYLDAYNNVPHVGHCHPRVAQCAMEQMTVLNTNTRYLHDGVNRYAQRLLSTMPAPLSVCYFVNSASEGNELALRLSRAFTERRGTIVLEAAYHGNTTSLVDISPYKHDGPGGKGAPTWVHTAPLADVYRGPYRADDPNAGVKYAEAVGRIADQVSETKEGLAAFICESCPSVGGQILFPDGYLQEAYRRVRNAGGVCIADEVQTGYGRIGTHFYAFEAQGVVPDIVVLGKPIGNGHPIGAVVTTSAIADAFDNGMEFFSTFGGNTVSCAVGQAVLDVVWDEGLQENARRTGQRLISDLTPLKKQFPIVGDVRGAGLFAGIELVEDLETLEPASEAAAFIVDRMRDQGVLMGIDGPFHNVIKIRPPMPFSEKDADRLVTTLARILEENFPP